MNRISLAIIILVVIVLGGWSFSRFSFSGVSNFEECVSADNPVMESYPRQCSHEGVTYVEDISNVPTSADNAPPGSIHNLPVPTAVSTVKKLVARRSGVSEGEVIVMTAYEKEWPDSCLGLSRPGIICAQVITPGYEVTVQVKGMTSTYRTNIDGTTVSSEK